MNKQFSWIYLILLVNSAAYGQTGDLDSTFGVSGITYINFNGSYRLSTMEIQQDQKILSAGSSALGIGGLSSVAIARNNPDGSYDNMFGENGKVIITHETDEYTCHACAIQSDGRIVIAGSINYESQVTSEKVDDFLLIRLEEDGGLDSTFGNFGIVRTDLGGIWEEAHDVLIQDDGKVVSIGFSVNDNNGMASFSIVRHLANGDIDSTFGNYGITNTYIQENAVANAGAIQPDGKIIVAGYTLHEFDEDFALIRYHQNGVLDSTFGNYGIVQTELSTGNLADAAQTVILGPDGKITAAGYNNYTFSESISNSGIVRYFANGTVDESFGENGMQTINVGISNQIHDVALQSNGKYIAAGATNIDDTTQYWLVLRLNYDGSADNSFGDHSVVLTDIEGDLERAYRVTLQVDNKILVGGRGLSDFVIARYNNSDGDTTLLYDVKPFLHSVFPNPCDDFISIDMAGQVGRVDCVISDITGKQLYVESVYPDADGDLIVDTKKLNPGFYVLSITHKQITEAIPFWVGN